MNWIDAMKLRRSRYNLSDKLPISEEKLQNIIEQCLLLAPSAFNSQSARIVLLLGEKHKQFWELVRACLRAVVPADKFAPTDTKISSFSAAYGTILYYDDMDTVARLQAQFAAYKENFPVWAHQANGMLQFAVWTALAEAGVGASLQHYNPLIDEKVQAAFSVNPSWKLVAQMPFGLAVSETEEKSYLPLDSRLCIER